jgi:tetratricopeptide (TPR) repeat protein
MRPVDYVAQRRPQFSSDAQRSFVEQAKYTEGLAGGQEQLAEVRARDPRHPDVGHLLYECATFQKLSGNLEDAIATTDETLAFDLAQEGEISWNTVRSLLRLAHLNILAGRHELAEQLIRRGLAALNQLPVEEQDDRYAFLMNQADIYSFRGQLREAELQILEALRLVSSFCDCIMVGNVCFELSWIYMRQRRLVAARRTMQKAIRFFEWAERNRLDEFQLGRMRYHLGRLHQRMNEPAEARHCFAAALAVIQSISPMESPNRTLAEKLCRERLADLEETLVTMP